MKPQNKLQKYVQYVYRRCNVFTQTYYEANAMLAAAFT